MFEYDTTNTDSVINLLYWSILALNLQNVSLFNTDKS